MSKTEFNLFEVLHRIGDAATAAESMLKVEELDITATEKKLKISHEAFLAEEDINSVQKVSSRPDESFDSHRE